MKNFLFYSRKCPDCRDLLIIMKNINILNKFKLICTDNQSINIPKYVRMVPTLIIHNINSPLEGEDAFKWVKSIKYLNTKRHIQNMEVNEISVNIDNKDSKIKEIKENNKSNLNNKIQKKKEILSGFLSSEMGEFSDQYAYTEKDDAKPQAFFDINKNNSSIFTAPEQEKLTEDKQKNMINELINNREKDYNNYTKIMRKQQIAAVVNHEKNNKHNT